MDSQSFSGEISRITFFDPTTNYTVARLKNSQGQLVTLVGNLPELGVGQQINVWGQIKNHPKYGQYLAVEDLENKTPNGLEGIKAYLASDLIKGVGPKLAEKIVEKFGEQTLKILGDSPEKLSQIKGITQKKALAIGEAWKNQHKLQQTMIYLQGLGISLNLSQKIINHYQEKTKSIVKNNPYQLSQDLYGIGFLTADSIAQKVGIKEDDPRRVKAAIGYILQEAQSQGHCFLPQEELVVRVTNLIADGKNNNGCSQSLILSTLQEVFLEKRVVVESVGDTKNIYLPFLYRAEKGVAERVKALIYPSKDRLTDLKEIDFEKAFEEFAQKEKLNPESQQKHAVAQAFYHPVTIMTGGPGTGKSTTVKILTYILNKFGKKFVLCAPTGRAAKRLSELTNEEAFTIHRLLKLKPGKAPKYNLDHSLPFDFVIVDETSMIDLPLAHQLLQAIQPGTHLLLVGDADQLPSVGPGNVLKDLINSQIIPTIFLNVIFRQAQKSQIIKNSHRIRQGFFPIFLKHPTDFYLFEENEAVSAANTILELISVKIPQTFGIPFSKIQVLTPIYKGEAGVLNLNKILQTALNPLINPADQLTIGGKNWRINDRVLQLSNNYDKEVFNGDLGIIKKINPTEKSLGVDFYGNLVEYQTDELDQLTHAFATTIHKSQGSEFEAVVMPILTSHYIMLERNLLYTGVTRAKKLLVLVGSKKALFIAVKNNRPEKRYTGLLEKLNSQVSFKLPLL